MGRVLRADYQQQYLLPPSLEDWVGQDHPVRFLRDFVDSLDLAALGIHEPEGVEGRPPYAADLQLKVWLYGYLEKIRSSRGLEKACKVHLPLLWLTGLKSPDHNTLWRFWVLNRAGLQRVFREVVLVAYRAGIVELVLHALDGTKIKAAVSRRTVLGKRDLQKLLQELDQGIAELMAEVEEREAGEHGEYRLPETLVDAQRRREQIMQALGELAAMERESYHPGDKEARVMKVGDGGQTGPGYNAQVVVDSSSGLIVAAHTTSAESDNGELLPMLEEVRETLGLVSQATVADGGYYSPRQLAEAEKRDYGVLVPVPDPQKSSAPHVDLSPDLFVYDREEDCYRCPHGEILAFEKSRPNSHGKYQVRVYHCPRGPDCRCSLGQSGRRITRSEFAEVIDRQRRKQQLPENRELMRQRKSIVEIVYAQIKELMGFRRFTVSGLAATNTQWSLICTAFNLKKLYPYWRNGILILN
jgi:transposase